MEFVWLRHGVLTSSGCRGTGAVQGGAESERSRSLFVCATDYWRHREAEARSSFRGVCLFVPGREYSRHRDAAVLERFLCQCAKVQGKVVTLVSSTFRRMSKEREQDVFKCRKKDPLSSAGNGRMFEVPARTASYEAKAGEKTTRSSCQTIQRNQRAEGRVPRSSTQTSSFRTVQRVQRAEGRAPRSSTQTIVLSNDPTKVPRKEKSAWEPNEKSKIDYCTSVLMIYNIYRRAICKHGCEHAERCTNSRLSASKTSRLPIEMIRKPGAGESRAYCTLFSLTNKKYSIIVYCTWCYRRQFVLVYPNVASSTDVGWTAYNMYLYSESKPRFKSVHTQYSMMYRGYLVVTLQWQVFRP